MVGDEPADPPRLAKRVCRRLQRSLKQPLPTADHRSVTEAMEALANLLAQRAPDEAPPAEVPMALTCAGIAAVRRLAREVDDEETRSMLEHTATLLFVLVLGARATEAPTADPATGEDGEAVEGVQEGMFDDDVLDTGPATPPQSEDAKALEAHGKSSYDETMRLAAGEAATSSWAAALRSPGALCQLIMQEGLARFARQEALHRYEGLAAPFFWASAAVTATSAFDEAAPGEFLSMQAASILGDGSQAKRLKALVDAAESELGQAVLRDLELSFTLPRALVGVRRCAVLSRATNVVITAEHPTVLNEAHASALRGAVWEYEHHESETVRMCALLAGLAVIMGRAGDMRKDDAFGGRVSLPFLETTPPAPGAYRLTLLPETDSWLVWAIDARSGELKVEMRQHGYEGCLKALLVFSGLVRPAG